MVGGELEEGVECWLSLADKLGGGRREKVWSKGWVDWEIIKTGRVFLFLCLMGQVCGVG